MSNKRSTLFNGRYISPEEREKIKAEEAKNREYRAYSYDLANRILKSQSKRRIIKTYEHY